MKDVEQIRAELSKFPRRAGQRYPAELRERVTKWARERRDEGEVLSAIAASVSLNEQTLGKWCARRVAKKLRRVQVESTSKTTRTLCFVSSAGNRLEGLTLEEATTLLRALG
jgi:hypothetical protein